MTTTKIYENYPYMKDETLPELFDELDSMAGLLQYHARQYNSWSWSYTTALRKVEEVRNEIDALITVIKERRKEVE